MCLLWAERNKMVPENGPRMDLQRKNHLRPASRSLEPTFWDCSAYTTHLLAKEHDRHMSQLMFSGKAGPITRSGGGMIPPTYSFEFVPDKRPIQDWNARQARKRWDEARIGTSIRRSVIADCYTNKHTLPTPALTDGRWFVRCLVCKKVLNLRDNRHLIEVH